MDLRCSFRVQRKLCESTDQSRGGQGLLAESAQVLASVETCRKRLSEPVEVCRESLVGVGACREKLVAVSLKAPLPTCLADDGFVVARLEPPAQPEQILLLELPELLPLRSLLAAECVIREMPSFDTLHRVSTMIARPRRAARLGIVAHPHSSHDWLRGIMRCAPADEANC